MTRRAIALNDRSRDSEFRGYVDVYYNTGNASAVVKWGARYSGLGAVNDLKLVDMMEDDAGDIDRSGKFSSPLLLRAGTSSSKPKEYGFSRPWGLTFQNTFSSGAPATWPPSTSTGLPETELLSK